MRKSPNHSRVSSRRERLERDEGEKGLRGTVANRLVVRKQVGSHRRLRRPGWPNYTFCFHDSEEIGPAALAKIGKDTGLSPEDL